MESKTIYRYPGSRPFEDTDIDRKLFFGREREKEELLQKIIARKLVVLHAVSGLGKTSLLNAGVSALLRDRGFFPIKVRFNMEKITPVQAVFSAIEETAAQRRLDIEPGETETLWHYFKTSAFWSTDDTLLTPVLILDQFEEFFNFHEPKARNEFISQLSDLVHNTIPQGLRQAIRTGEPYRYGDEPPRVKIVMSIRSDFVGQLDELSSAIPEIMDNRYRLLALSHQQAREAITGPAQIQNEQMFSRRFRYSEDALNMMLNYLSKRREREGVVNKDEIESFQLQLLCRHIETSLIEKAGRDGEQDELEVKKEDLGGEAGMNMVFQFFYENQLAGLKLAPNKRRVRRLCGKGLISDSDRRLSLDEEVIEKQFKVSPGILSQLVESRLLRAEKRVGSVYYELSHDTLIDPIRLSQRKSRTTLEYALLLLALVIIAVMIIILTSRGDSKQNKLDKLFKEAEQSSFDLNIGQAMEKYNQILKADPKNIMAIVKLGELLRGGGQYKDYKDAVQLYTKAIANGVTDDRVYAGLGRMLFKFGKEEEAINYLNEAIKRNPGHTDAYETLGDHYADKKKFKIAIENYEKVLAINNKKKEVYEKLAVLYVETGEKDKAIVVFKRAIEVDAEFTAGIYQAIRDVLQQKNDMETLETLYGIALQCKSKDAFHYLLLGDDYSKLGKYDAAIIGYRKALELKPDYAEAYNDMGNAQYEKGDYDGAIASYRKALELKPDSAEAYNNIGNAQYDKGDHNAALESYKKALELKPDYAQAYNNIGNTQYDKGDYDAALASYQKALNLKPGYVEAYTNMGLAFAAKGDYDAAIENYQKALNLKPGYDEAYTNMGLAFASKGDYDAAIESCQKALNLKPDNVVAYINLGIAQSNKGDYNAAIASYMKAMEINPTDFSAKENLAELYLTTEHFDKAMELAYQVLNEKKVTQDQTLAMKSIVISSLFFFGDQSQALMELQQLITYYRVLSNKFKREWDYSTIKKFITQTQRLNEPTRALLLKMIELLEAPKKDGDKILVELEKMAREFK